MYVSFTVDLKQLNTGLGSHKLIYKALPHGASCPAQANAVVEDKEECGNVALRLQIPTWDLLQCVIRSLFIMDLFLSF